MRQAAFNCPRCARRSGQLNAKKIVDLPCCWIIIETEREDRRSVDGGVERAMGLGVVVGGLSY